MTKINIQIELPDFTKYQDILRFLVQTSHGEPYHSFIASIYSYCIQNEGITEKQIEALIPYINNLKEKIKLLELENIKRGDYVIN